ncbi:reverse transcriptase-like protein [Jatrophihabitans sp.]|uniref:reverse transcriptase-like protein n=1 Tax=Jatrophihabitans sp. TaxID=1932789 RepID=UPI0030C6AA06|nr:acid phosphatase [Jatrophihabitans sp.]
MIVQADGGARGNPGWSGCGALVLDGKTRELLLFGAEQTGMTTNNVAEYRALALGLVLAERQAATHVAVQMDSRLVVEQMSGRWAVRDEVLSELHEVCQALAGRFEVVTYEWIPREMNTEADWLANAAMDGRPITAPPSAAGPMTSRSVAPTMAKRKKLVRRKQARLPSTTQRVASIEATAALASRLKMDGDVADVCARLVNEAPDELAVIWENVPGAKWLTDTVSSAPLSWRYGGSVQSVEGVPGATLLVAL